MNNNKKIVTLKDIINSGMIEEFTDIIVSEQYKNGATAVTTNIISDYLNHEVINISPFSPNALCVKVKSKKDIDFVPDLTESKNMTICDLKEAIRNLPDDMEVFLPIYHRGNETNIIPKECYQQLVTLRDYKNAGVFRTIPNGFEIYDYDLEDEDGTALLLTHPVFGCTTYLDCKVRIISPDPRDCCVTAFYIDTTNIRTKSKISKEDFIKLIKSESKLKDSFWTNEFLDTMGYKVITFDEDKYRIHKIEKIDILLIP